MSLKPAFRVVGTAALAALALAAAAQQPNPLDVVPDKMPNDIPYGAPIALDHAQAAINAAVAESKKRGWKLNVAVMDSGGNLVAFARMDGAQLASIAISEHKARVAVKFRRETRAIEGGVQSGLGFPTSDLRMGAGGVTSATFEGGKITCTKKGVCSVS